MEIFLKTFYNSIAILTKYVHVNFLILSEKGNPDKRSSQSHGELAILPEVLLFDLEYV